MAIDHKKCGSESRQFCDDLLTELQKLDPTTSRAEKTNCGFKTQNSNRFAYLYHKMDSTVATIYLRGDDPDGIPTLSNGARVELRDKLNGNWAMEYALFVHLPLGTSPIEVANLLTHYSLPLTKKKKRKTAADERFNDVQLKDGKVRAVLSTRYERNRNLRMKCLAHYGYQCAGCDLKMIDRYGPIAEEVIHVHHLVAISKTGERIVDPIVDLVPLCPNCHAVVHVNKEPLSIKMLRVIIRAHLRSL